MSSPTPSGPSPSTPPGRLLTCCPWARAAYEGRDLPAGTLDRTRRALLADVREEAGCTDSEVLTHLRSPGPHARGCGVVDRILGKS